jgi:hypothetical protein
MKRFVLICFLTFSLAAGAFADDHDGFGLGAVFYGGYGYGPGLLLKTPVLPLYWGVHVSLGAIDDAQSEPYFAITLSGDYHFLDTTFPNTEKFGWFLGGGIIFSHNHHDGKNALSGRVPIGIYFAPVKKFDFVLELAPALGFFSWDSKIEFDYGMSGLFGVRYWF